MNRVGNEFSMCDTIASQLVRHYLPRLTMTILEQTFEKALGRLAIESSLKKYIDIV